MTLQNIAAALRRAEAALRRRPRLGLQDDPPATARWLSGTRVVSSHGNGTHIVSDLARELGGSGEHVTPGWLFRAGLASCAATTIAMRAATAGIELTTLEVLATSRSDTCGALGMRDASGNPVYAGPRDVHLLVRIAAHGASPQRLRGLVEDACRCSPIPVEVQNSMPLGLHIDAGAG